MMHRHIHAVDAGTGRAAWNAAWESAWPRLLRRCAHLFRGDMDAADDLAAGVALQLCRWRAEGRLQCWDLASLACHLARLQWRGACRTATWRNRQLERLRIHIAKRGGYKVITSHEFMYDEEKNDNVEK